MFARRFGPLSLAALVLAFGLAGCGAPVEQGEVEQAVDTSAGITEGDPYGTEDTTAGTTPAQPLTEAPRAASPTPKPAAAKPQAAAPQALTPSAPPVAAAAPQRPRYLNVPAGTVIAVEFWREISSATANPGERFRATVVDPVYVDEWVAIPAGAVVSGSVLEVMRGKKIGGSAQLTVEFNQVKLESGAKYPLSASFHEAGKSSKKKDAMTIGGAAAGGAVVGRKIGGNDGHEADGTAIGAIVGAAIGTAVAAKTQGEQVVITEGMVVEIVLDSPVEIDSGA